MFDCLRLENPKTICYDGNNLKASTKIIEMTSLNDVLVNDLTPITSIRSEKKNKIHAKTIDSLDVKKNKIKSKKKLRTQISINDDDDLVTEYSKISSRDQNVPISQVRAAKIPKKQDDKENLDSKYKLKSQKSIQTIGNKYNTKTVVTAKPGEISIDSDVSIQNLAEMLQIPATEIIKSLFLQGTSVTMNDIIDIKMAKSVAKTYRIKVIDNSESTITSHKQIINNQDFSNQNLQNRDPIVSIFGHVDHGKTTLLDAIRKRNSVDMEAGGITQAIVAYKVPVAFSNFNNIIFLDTPGHEAFSDMRIRGVQVTDIAILVVAADDGLQPQTIESVNHLQKNNVSFIVAINKIDSAGANVLKIKEELANLNIMNHEWGGSIPIVEISALLHLNIDQLLESIKIMASNLKLIANFEGPGSGTVLDAYLDKQQGPIANLLVQNGQIKVGDYIKIDKIISKVRSITDSCSNRLTAGVPSSIIFVSGLEAVPISGNLFYIMNNSKKAKKQYIETQKNKDKSNKSYKKLNSSTFFDSSFVGHKKELGKIINIILKTDSEGTIAAILNAFKSLPQIKVQLNIISAGVGEVTINDVDLAIISKSIIISFNNMTSIASQQMAIKNNIVIKNFVIIYDLIDYIKISMLELIDIEYNENIIGYAIVKNVFNLSKGIVAGCLVTQGKLKRKAYIRVTRSKQLIYSGQLTSLKRIKDDVEEVNVNNECGLFCDGFDSWQINDNIQVYELIPKEKTLNGLSPSA
uniref:Translation initiation factor IF-2, chloroplastic n=1 Tax=Dichotomaria marginata TaxID=268567 RepID=A0A1G4NSL1_9FLOR|nr:Translation initiation factor 2 [Dichotomaria marginata]SCW21556.1 Translation initiation factor 2 [Dichotomaria marginata]